MRDPLVEGAEPFKPKEEGEGQEFEDPYSRGAEPFSPVPFNGIIQKKTKEIPLRGMEKFFAEQYPNVYAGMRTMLDFFPFAGYAMPSERDAFVALDQEDQTRVLLMHSLGAALWGRSPELFKAGAMAYRGMIKAPMRAIAGQASKRIGIAGTPKVVPYEDAMKKIGNLLGKERVVPFSYAEQAEKRLINKGFGKDEAEAVVSVLHGEGDGALLDVVVNRKYAGKTMTKAFTKSTEWQKGRAYPSPTLKKRITEEMGEDVLRTNFYNRQFESVLTKDVYKTKPAERTTKHIFNAHVKRLFPEAEGLGFGDITPHQMSNVILDMVEHKAVSWQIAHPTIMATLKPARVVFGYGENVLGTFTGVYEPLKGALARMNRSYFNNSLLFAKMLEQRGAYTAVKIKASGEFRGVKAKWLTPDIQNEAYTVLRQMDDLTMQASRIRAKGQVAELQEAAAKLGQEASPEAKVLIETWRSFSDHLYSQHVKLQIPRIFRKAGLTRLGQNQIDMMMTGPGGLNNEINRLFAAVSQKNPTEKINGVKEILGKVKARLEHAGEKHPYFTAEGDDLIKVMKGLDKELSWRKGGFMRYLDNYVARVSKHQDSLMMKWRGGLFKEQSAFYTKLRQLEKMKGEPVDFGTMIQARTMAHSKEHFLYDKLGEVVEYTKGLPPAWIEYTESYFSGILGVPTVSDYKLAQFFTKTVGGLSRLMGKEGLWSERRVINLAYSVNNLTYLGGLGFKPFSAVRNLFQPLLTVPADLGGLKDLGKLVEGYRWALNPKNRAYIRDIGAIAEYAPEIHLRPSIMRQGKVIFGKEMPTLEGTRDVAMWMFKASDRFNRYTTGGAANIKWDRLMRKQGGQVKPEDVLRFSKKLNLQGRYPWKQAEVEDLLMRGKFADAKATYINDVIADTQYLYGAAEAPVALRKYGAVGRTGAIFQSWWMNYGTILQKWMTTGVGPGAKAERALTMVLSQGMAYSLMAPLWGGRTAIRTVGLGPFPSEFNEFLLPPSWSPVYHAAAAIRHIQTPEVSARHAKAVLDSSAILIPGGLQMKTFYKGYREDEWRGFAKAFLRLK